MSWRDLFTVMLGGTYRATLRYRALELPHYERPPLNSATDRVLLQLSADPPDGPLGRMVPDEPEDQS